MHFARAVASVQLNGYVPLSYWTVAATKPSEAIYVMRFSSIVLSKVIDVPVRKTNTGYVPASTGSYPLMLFEELQPVEPWPLYVAVKLAVVSASCTEPVSPSPTPTPSDRKSG